MSHIYHQYLCSRNAPVMLEDAQIHSPKIVNTRCNLPSNDKHDAKD